MNHEDAKKELLKNKKFAAVYTNKSSAYSIGREIKKLRIKNGLTQTELAQKINTKQPGIARLENGTAGIPHDNTLKKIADAFGVSLVASRFANTKDIEKNIRISFYKSKYSKQSIFKTNFTKNKETPCPCQYAWDTFN